MTDEERAALQAEAEAKAEAEDAEFEAGLEGLSEEEVTQKRTEREAKKFSTIEAELKREREAREKAEKALADRAFKEREERRKSGEDKPLTASELESILVRERQFTQKEVRSVQISELAGRMSESDVEKNLIIEVHKNRTFPEHLSIEEQLEESYLIANRKKILGERAELLRALRGREGVTHDAASTHRDAPEGGEPNIPPADAQAFKAAGFVWNGKSRQYEKKLSNGSLLIRDSKTKQTRLVKPQ